jgi:L-ascorbate metabolism protein UlaG (beta-lactamase superfamily)
MTEDLDKLIEAIHWFGHDSFHIAASVSIYIDPWKLPPGSPAADIVLVSHEHHDHLSPDDIERIRRDDTVVVANPSAAPNIKLPVRILNPGEEIEHRGVKIRGLPAYNLDKPFHTMGASHLGFLLGFDGWRVYFAGDTDFIPEMEGIKCDIAMLPVSGTYVMTAEEAAQASRVITARGYIPMHYGAGVAGTLEDAERFKTLCDRPVYIMQKKA